MRGAGHAGRVAPGKSIEVNDQFRRALELMERTDRHVFVTGKAGTGKSTLLDLFRTTTKKRIAVLAPTGVAAVNVQGQTIHSFFRFRPDITVDTVKRARGPDAGLYRAIDALVIDEISMVRADLLDCVDRFLRLNGPDRAQPFGGVQMIFFGDLYQLPPVVTGAERAVFSSHYQSQYFFDAAAFRGFPMEFIELEKVYRQKDEQFIGILNAIRNRTAGERELAALNERVDPWFAPKADAFYVHLTSTNAQAAEINAQALAKLKTKPFRRQGALKGDFDISRLPTDLDLQVKPGAQVMLVNNDPAHRWVNGTVGKVLRIEEADDGVHAGRTREKAADAIIVALQDGATVDVEPHTWNMARLRYNQEKRSLESETLGSFTQYPLRLAWAVTIHKSQGKTFDRVIVDLGRGTFAHGQLYVALSRCTSLEGIVLRQPVQQRHIIMDWKVVRFLTKYQYGLSEQRLPLREKMEMIRRAIAQRRKLRIVYLKSSDVKSRRVILPKRVGEMEYLGRPYTGVEAYCFSRQADRVFRVDKILEMEEEG